MTPSARSTKYLRDQGYIVTRVEQRLQMPKSPFPITKDAFGFGDLLVAYVRGCLPVLHISPATEQALRVVALVQVTSRANHNARKTKILTEHDPLANPCAHCMAPIWRSAGGKILLQSWAKRGPRGKRKTWQVTEEWL